MNFQNKSRKLKAKEAVDIFALKIIEGMHDRRAYSLKIVFYQKFKHSIFSFKKQITPSIKKVIS